MRKTPKKKNKFQIEAEREYANAILMKQDISRRWGFSRLLECVSVKNLKAWVQMKFLFSQAITSSDYPRLYEVSLGYMRGLKALEQDALSRGFKELPKNIWCVDNPIKEYEDWKIFICESDKALPTACAMSNNEPKTLYYTARELIAMNAEAMKTKIKFRELGQVTITEMTPTTQKDIDGVALHDEIL
jgi:hypothetical protein